MGALLQRQRQSTDDDVGSAVFCYKYPPKSGNYFGTHFMLGDERFETTQPESFLFGENYDLNFLGSKPVQFPYLPRVVARPLNCLIAIRRDSLRFVRVGNGSDSQGDSSDLSSQYNIEFVFDCDVPCTITVYYFATEIMTSKGLTYVSAYPEMTSHAYRYDIGCNQLFSVPEHMFNPPEYKSEEMNYDPNLEIIPVVIHCVEEVENGSAPQSHSTFATIERSTEEHSLILKPLKQKLFIDSVCYLLQEVYGVENKSQAVCSVGVATTSTESDDSGAECVVCMSEWRDTLILPCRHLCLCNICAETLRYKASNCPICRSPFRALLQIKSVRKLRPSSAPMLSLSENMEKFEPSVSSKQYEQIPLIEMLNGPTEFRSFSKQQHQMPATSSVPVIQSTSPMTSGRHVRRKNKNPLVEIQQVLTPQNLNKPSVTTTFQVGSSGDATVTEQLREPNKDFQKNDVVFVENTAENVSDEDNDQNDEQLCSSGMPFSSLLRRR